MKTKAHMYVPSKTQMASLGRFFIAASGKQRRRPFSPRKTQRILQRPAPSENPKPYVPMKQVAYVRAQSSVFRRPPVERLPRRPNLTRPRTAMIGSLATVATAAALDTDLLTIREDKRGQTYVCEYSQQDIYGFRLCVDKAGDISLSTDKIRQQFRYQSDGTCTFLSAFQVKDVRSFYLKSVLGVRPHIRSVSTNRYSYGCTKRGQTDTCPSLEIRFLPWTTSSMQRLIPTAKALRTSQEFIVHWRMSCNGGVTQ